MGGVPPADSVTRFSWQFGDHQTITFPALFVAAACHRRASFVMTNHGPAFLGGCFAFYYDPT